MTPMGRKPTPAMCAHTASVLSSVAGTMGMAQAALAGDPIGATNLASPFLRRVQTVVDELSESTADDQDLWGPVSALRDEIGSYLLAAEALQQSGVAPIVTVALLQRGTHQAQQRVDRLANLHEKG